VAAPRERRACTLVDPRRRSVGQSALRRSTRWRPIYAAGRAPRKRKKKKKKKTKKKKKKISLRWFLVLPNAPSTPTRSASYSLAVATSRRVTGTPRRASAAMFAGFHCSSSASSPETLSSSRAAQACYPARSEKMSSRLTARCPGGRAPFRIFAARDGHRRGPPRLQSPLVPRQCSCWREIPPWSRSVSAYCLAGQGGGSAVASPFDPYRGPDFDGRVASAAASRAVPVSGRSCSRTSFLAIPLQSMRARRCGRRAC